MKLILYYSVSVLLCGLMLSCAGTPPQASPGSLIPPDPPPKFSPTDHLIIALRGESGETPKNVNIAEVREGTPPTIVLVGLANTPDQREWEFAITIEASITEAFSILRGNTIAFIMPSSSPTSPSWGKATNAILEEKLIVINTQTDEIMTYAIEIAFSSVPVQDLITAASFEAHFAMQNATIELIGNTIHITNLNNQARGVAGIFNLSARFSLPSGYNWDGPRDITDPDDEATSAIDFRLEAIAIFEETTDEAGTIVRLIENSETYTIIVHLDEPLTPLVSSDVTAMFAGLTASPEDIVIIKDNIVISGFRNIGDENTLSPGTVVVTERSGVFTAMPTPDPLLITNPAGILATDEITGTIAITPTGAIEAVLYDVTVVFGAALEVEIPGTVVEGPRLGVPIVLVEGNPRTESISVRRCGYYNPVLSVIQGEVVHPHYSARTTRAEGIDIDPYYDSVMPVNNTNEEQIQVLGMLHAPPVATFTIMLKIQECLVNENGFAAGTGTEEDPWVVDTDMRLNLVSQLVNMNASIYVDNEYVMTADIDLDLAGTRRTWTETAGGFGFAPIGRTSEMIVSSSLTRNQFSGLFDCSGYTISNLYINNETPSGLNKGTHLGLFGMIARAGTVRHCTLENANITGFSDLGALAGMNFGKIENCSAMSGSVRGMNNNVGGLIGLNEGYIRTSHASGPVKGNYYVGGLIGLNQEYAIVSYSYASGAVAGPYFIGGLIGFNYGAITNGYATGNVTGSEGAIGGLIGYSDNHIEMSHATGNVTGRAYVGGLIGSNIGYIKYSYASGVVNGTSNVGGLVGESKHDAIVSSSHASGNVTGSYNVGGLVGQNEAEITTSYASGTVTGLGDYLGGLVGSNNNRVEQSYASGAVIGNFDSRPYSLYVGGLVGITDMNGHIVSSYASGDVTGGEHYTGGLVGNSINRVTLTDSYASGHVTSQLVGTSYEKVGGLAGVSALPFINSYWDTQTTGQFMSGTEIAGTTGGRTTAELTADPPVTTGERAVYMGWNEETGNPATTKAGTWEFISGSYPKLLRVACANRQYAADPVPDCQ